MITLTQLEYVVAVDEFRHFATAADKCFVTQPTLSMQIKKLEDDLGVIIFDRSRQPVVPTDIGYKLIEQARIVLASTQRIKEIINEEKQEVAGSLKIGIIPTLAPYLLPIFIGDYIRRYPGVHDRQTRFCKSADRNAPDLRQLPAGGRGGHYGRFCHCTGRTGHCQAKGG